MFKILLLAACVAIVAATSPNPHEPTDLLQKFESDVRPDGFDYVVETTNFSTIKASGDEHGNIVGSYYYVAPDNTHVSVEYVANENGYQPVSDFLPTPPPIPAAILKSLEYIRTHSVPKDSVL